MENSMENFIEFHKIPSTSVSQNSTENSIEFHGIFHGIPWKFHGKSVNMKISWNFMEFHGIFHKHLTDFPWKIP
jgi:hypothetical protein